MKKEVKDTIAVEIGEKLKGFLHFYPVGLTGLNVGATSALRRKCFKYEIKMVAVKSTLLRETFDAPDADYESLYDSSKGNTAVIFTQTANASAKLPKEYQKEGIPALKAACTKESIYVGTDRLAELTALKSKNEVITKTVALLQSPAKNIVSTLRSGASTIHGTLETLGERSE